MYLVLLSLTHILLTQYLKMKMMKKGNIIRKTTRIGVKVKKNSEETKRKIKMKEIIMKKIKKMKMNKKIHKKTNKVDKDKKEVVPVV